MLRSKPNGDFEYLPAGVRLLEADHQDDDLVIALSSAVAPTAIASALSGLHAEVRAEPLLELAPLFWYRVRSDQVLSTARVSECLESGGVNVRYVTSARTGSMGVAPPLRHARLGRGQRERWRLRRPRSAQTEAGDERWFASPLGVNVDSELVGTGRGMQLAVIDNDGGALDAADLDDVILVEVEEIPRGSRHAISMVAWATGTDFTQRRCFHGVAPDAAARVYVVPKAGKDVFSVPLAIARATGDGADVIVCATFLEGVTGPLLDDALELAGRFGRKGCGAPVVFAVGRNFSSPPGRTHASLSLGFSEPASDPRVFCIGPSSRCGSWFFWKDRHGKLRPFANRGPALRWLAPGDDVVDPIRQAGPPGHTESSGASAFAAGVLLLILAANPDLTVSELDEIVTRTASAPEAETGAANVADPADLLPFHTDADGHNAKHGYGRIDAALACSMARDPVAGALICIGETAAAKRYLRYRATRGLYSESFGRWAARVALRDRSVLHGLCALVRHARLISANPEREACQAAGTSARALHRILLQLLDNRMAPRASAAIGSEARALATRARAALRDHQAASTDRAFAEVVAVVFEVCSASVAPGRNEAKQQPLDSAASG